MARLSHGELVQMEQAGRNAERCVCCGEIIPEGRQVCPACFRGGKVPEYKSPVEMIIGDMELKMSETLEKKIMAAVQEIDVKIDKAGLIRALEADRKVHEGKLVEVVRCKDCKWADWYTVESGRKYAYCFEHDMSALEEDDFCSYAERRTDE